MENPAIYRSRVIRLHTCLEIIGLSRSTVFDISNPKSPRYDPNFPQKVRIGVRAVGWYEDQIFQWLASRQDTTESSPAIPD
jgi:prophage regulatory protein